MSCESCCSAIKTYCWPQTDIISHEGGQQCPSDTGQSVDEERMKTQWVVTSRHKGSGVPRTQVSQWMKRGWRPSEWWHHVTRTAVSLGHRSVSVWREDEDPVSGSQLTFGRASWHTEILHQPRVNQDGTCCRMSINVVCAHVSVVGDCESMHHSTNTVSAHSVPANQMWVVHRQFLYDIDIVHIFIYFSTTMTMLCYRL